MATAAALAPEQLRRRVDSRRSPFENAEGRDGSRRSLSRPYRACTAARSRTIITGTDERWTSARDTLPSSTLVNAL